MDLSGETECRVGGFRDYEPFVSVRPFPVGLPTKAGIVSSRSETRGLNECACKQRSDIWIVAVWARVHAGKTGLGGHPLGQTRRGGLGYSAVKRRRPGERTSTETSSLGYTPPSATAEERGQLAARNGGVIVGG